jgi:hypothetical protein
MENPIFGLTVCLEKYKQRIDRAIAALKELEGPADDSAKPDHHQRRNPHRPGRAARTPAGRGRIRSRAARPAGDGPGDLSSFDSSKGDEQPKCPGCKGTMLASRKCDTCGETKCVRNCMRAGATTCKTCRKREK